MQKVPKVLVVDDFEINRLVLGEILRRQGYEVLEADNGTQARMIAAKEPPDLILLDIMMPGENGLDTCRKLKGHKETADIPIIFVTALPDVNHKMAAFESGAVDYIIKPFHAVEIAARVRLHLRLARAQNEIAAMQAESLGQLAKAQNEMLVAPESDPDAKFKIARSSVAEAGGDFYDVVNVSENIRFYIVADVCGHGIKASYATAALKALTSQNVNALNTPQETLKTINSVLMRMMGEGNHVTAICALVNRESGMVEVVSAGHAPAIRLTSEGKTERIGSPGEPLGVFQSIVLSSQIYQTNFGERLYLYTDGMIEAEGRTRTEGLAALEKTIIETAGTELGEAVKEIFTGHSSAKDDATLLGIEI